MNITFNLSCLGYLPDNQRCVEAYAFLSSLDAKVRYRNRSSHLLFQ